MNHFNDSRKLTKKAEILLNSFAMKMTNLVSLLRPFLKLLNKIFDKPNILDFEHQIFTILCLGAEIFWVAN